jgi:hypothetical protein
MYSRLKFHLTAIVALVLAGCGSDPGFDERTAFERKEGAAQFVNMIADSPELTVLHGINQTQVEFGTASAVELRFEDEYDWELAYLTRDNDFKTIERGEDQQVTENFTSVFLLMGTVEDPLVQVVDLELIPLEDRPTDSTVIWFAADLANQPMVDIYLTTADADLAASSPFTSVNSGGATSLFEVPAASEQRLRLTEAGTQTLLFDSGSINLPAQSTTLFAAIDDFGPDGSNHVNVIRTDGSAGGAMTDISQSAAARAANLSSATSLDIVLGPLTFANTGTTRTTFSELAGGQQALTVINNGTETEARQATIIAGQYHSVYVFDSSDGTTGAMTSLLALDDLRPVTDRAQFLFVNGNSEIIDLYALRNGASRDDVPPVFDNIGFTATAATEVLTGSIRFLAVTADGAEVLTSVNSEMVPGQLYTVIYDSSGTLSVLTD